MGKILTFLSGFLGSKIVVATLYFAALALYFGLFLTFYTYTVTKFREIYLLVQEFINYLSSDSLFLNQGLKDVLMSMLNSLGITSTINTFFPLFVTTLHFLSVVLIIRFSLLLYKKFLSQLFRY